MAKDDYHVLAYRLLSYFYACLKAGETPQTEYFKYGTDKFPIGEAYWEYLIRNLYTDGYIDGVMIVPIMGKGKGIKLTPDICITPKGIEYLQENSMMKKAHSFLKEIMEIIPGA